MPKKTSRTNRKMENGRNGRKNGANTKKVKAPHFTSMVEKLECAIDMLLKLNETFFGKLSNPQWYLTELNKELNNADESAPIINHYELEQYLGDIDESEQPFILEHFCERLNACKQVNIGEAASELQESLSNASKDIHEIRLSFTKEGSNMEKRNSAKKKYDGCVRKARMLLDSFDNGAQPTEVPKVSMNALEGPRGSVRYIDIASKANLENYPVVWIYIEIIRIHGEAFQHIVDHWFQPHIIEHVDSTISSREDFTKRLSGILSFQIKETSPSAVKVSKSTSNSLTITWIAGHADDLEQLFDVRCVNTATNVATYFKDLTECVLVIRHLVPETTYRMVIFGKTRLRTVESVPLDAKTNKERVKIKLITHESITIYWYSIGYKNEQVSVCYFKTSDDVVKTCRLATGTREYTLKGLNEECEYEITVIATVNNEEKWNDNLLVSTRRKALLHVKVMDVKSDSILISWTLDGGDEDSNSFNVYYRILGEESEATVQKIDNETSYRIVRLQQDTKYGIVVICNIQGKTVKSNALSVYTKGKHETLIAYAPVDASGGILENQPWGTSLYVPPGAVPANSGHINTSISSSTDAQHIPELPPGHSRVSSSVRLDIHDDHKGMSRNLSLAFPVSRAGDANIDLYVRHPNRPNFERVTSQSDITYTESNTQIIVNTRTSGVFTAAEEIPQEHNVKVMRIIPFVAFDRRDSFMTIRVYLTLDTKDSEQAVIAEAEKSSSNKAIGRFRQCDSQHLQLEYDKGDIEVSVSVQDFDQSWQLMTESTHDLKYHMSWTYGMSQYRYFLLRLKDTRNIPTNFRGTVTLKQERQSGRSVPVQIDTPLSEDEPLHVNRPVTEFKRPPFDDKELYDILDVLRQGASDWRHLAEKLNIPTAKITLMEQKQDRTPSYSPAEEVIGIWASQEGDITRRSYERLYGILKEIGNDVCAGIVQKAAKDHLHEDIGDPNVPSGDSEI
ncbi:uncharacterized protein [Ptychodera flava]|uniref:uncharacterized protein n=1 Tax=Ptychodera flava TaxID=63121 RepID=UPI00396A5AF2